MEFTEGAANTRNGVFNAETNLAPEELLDLCLVGSLLTSKPVRFNVLRDRLSELWQPGQGVEISKMAENKFLFQFYHMWDLERIFQGGPWLFDNFMLVLRKTKFGEEPLALPLNEAEIWVQIHQLPLGFMNENIGVLIGEHIGKFIGYDA
ncbi:uncharacterized protein LOC131635240 [Vicia villosa]|uniref:uncharacterized protein LOC131635240 n=1 Tax=Vicia villosa TaxID=3911 RepID=UPI00273AD870|nr:uncharacterized protein LOC131635240 [Vicia villosa]